MRCRGALLLIALLSFACNREHRRRIAVIPKGTAHIFWQSVHAGAEAAGKELNEEILWDGPANETDYSRQLEIFDSMLNRHVDGVVVAATDKTILNASLDRAAREHIPVVVFDSGVDSTNYLSFIATNNFEGGSLAAMKLGELLKGQGDIAMVSNAPGSASTMEREAGFKATMEKSFPGIHIVAEQFSMSNRAKALAVTENMLTAHPHLSGIFASAEPGSVGAAQAVKSHNVSGKVRLIAFDSSDGLVKDLEEGVIDALVAQDPYRIGYESVKALNDPKAPKRVALPPVVVSKADLNRPDIVKLLHPVLK